MVNIAICGANGKMGKTIYNCVKNRDNINIVGGIDINTEKYADFEIVENPNDLSTKPDVIVDYSHPNVLKSLLEYCLTNGVPVVLATTGYSDEQINDIKKASEQIPVFFSWNMSLGINLLVGLSKKATEILGNQFDIEIVEKHHNQKVDAPSGTALMIANSINETLETPHNYVYDRHSQRKKRDKNEIGIHSIRGGTIVGEHEVIFAGNDEIISLKHVATSKTVFAEGSLNASIFLKDKPAGIYDMSNLISEN
ncbi:MAG: 4-hydroxy-tetrahydrodipicolinate reductase [Ruminococcus sp.]|nr:4-hydroxy-tetrahydrodipicolinate reductase [Ruminococcus sp.]MCD7800443.1 4-hydroxy-tetrahydrodipicolinate reductase [Ruminococcus sp.]